MRTEAAVLLALDTSTRMIGLALYDGSQVLCEHTWLSVDYHTVELAPAVKQALDKLRLKPADLSALAVATGPGSFTGMRIGLALAKGIAFAQHIPLVGIPSLDILAAAQPPGDHALVCLLRAGRGRLASGWYRSEVRSSDLKPSWRLQGKIEVLTLDELKQRITEPSLLCGELGKEERALLADNDQLLFASPEASVRRPAYLASLAWARWQDGLVDNPATLAPFYLHYNISQDAGNLSAEITSSMDNPSLERNKPTG